MLIACDNATLVNEIAVPHRINLWDMTDGSLAHQLPIPAGLPQSLDVSPNGRYLVVMLEDSDGLKLSAWRLDGMDPVKEVAPTATCGARPLKCNTVCAGILTVRHGLDAAGQFTSAVLPSEGRIIDVDREHELHGCPIEVSAVPLPLAVN